MCQRGHGGWLEGGWGGYIKAHYINTKRQRNGMFWEKKTNYKIVALINYCSLYINKPVSVLAILCYS